MLDDVLKSVVSFFESNPERNLSEPELAYRMLVASTLFGLDGLSEAEKVELERRATALPKNQLRIAATEGVATRASFDMLVSRHDALEWTSAKKDEFRAWLLKMARVDNEYTPEEKAFLIQMAQLIEDRGRVDLFIAVRSVPPDGDHGHRFFEYVTKEDFDRRFCNSECPFEPAQIYTSHPFLADAVLPFKTNAFEEAQSSAVLKLVELLQMLGAKRCRIHNARKQEFGVDANASAGVSGKLEEMPPLDLSMSRSANFKRVSNDMETWEGEFEGGVSLLRYFLPFYWWRKIDSRFRAFSEYESVIRHRSGTNRVKYFRHTVRQEKSHALAIALSAAMKIDKSLAANASSGLNASHVLLVEREFEVHF